jgi:hypothetical protein
MENLKELLRPPFSHDGTFIYDDQGKHLLRIEDDAFSGYWTSEKRKSFLSFVIEAMDEMWEKKNDPHGL